MINKTLQKKLMQYCCDVAIRGLGFTYPNPVVGALLVNNDGTIIAEGYHHKYGEMHAEIDVINNAKLSGIKDFSDLILFVTLEPCNHFGKQPPCVDTIIDIGIKNVVVGIEDPNPIVKGKGIERLRNEGVNVIVGVEEKYCYAIIANYIHYITKGMPYITLKVAQSMDGYIASAHWKSKYITCKESRKEVHYLRSFCAVLVGINTILVDNPILDNRLLDDDAVIKNASSKIIILDSNLCTPLKSKVFSIKENRTIFIAYSENLDVDIPEIKKKKESLEKKGAILIKSPTKNGKIHLRKLLSLLSVEFNIIHILVEGGGKIFSSFINSMLFNELIIYTASIVLGDGVKAFPDVDIDILNSALNKYNGINFMIGKDVVSLFVNRE